MYSMYYKTHCVFVIVKCIAQSVYIQVQVQVHKYTQVQASSVVCDQVLAAALLAPDVYHG